MKTREDALIAIAENVAALTQGFTTVATATRSPGLGADGLRRRRPEQLTYRLTHPPLLHQLVAALLPARAGSDEPTTGSKPGYRAPSSAGASAALDQISRGWRVNAATRQVGVWALRADMRAAAGQRPPRANARIRLALEDIRSLAHVLPEPWPQEAAVASAAWVARARAALTLDPPRHRFRDVVCPYCQVLLEVLEDSQVRCVNRDCLDDEGRRHRWGREEIAFLLEQLARGEGAA